MKEIVVGIDFSKGALNALKYAAFIAKGLNCKITLIWVDKPHNPDGIYEEENYRDAVHNRFKEIIKEYEPIVGKDNIQYKIRSGKVYEEISSYAKINNSSYVIIGTHGISGFEELWIGSNANRVVSTSPCPTFTLRQNYAIENNLKRIVLPIDRSDMTMCKIPFAVELAKSFGAEIILIKMHETKFKFLNKRVNSATDKIISILSKEKIKYSVVEKQITNVTNDIISIVEKNNADLLVIMTDQQKQSFNVMLGEAAQQLVNHCPVPVLSIHEDDKI